MQLTQRAEKIIRVLLRFPQDEPVPISIISEDLNVSDRSIQRELPAVEKWLESSGYHFLRKRSVGLFLDEPPERRTELLELLDSNRIQGPSVDDKKLRKTLLTRELLFAKEPIKSYYFTSKFLISEGTLSSDLNVLSKWLKKYQLRLVRRQGLGIFIEGSEISRRQAITSHLCSSMNEMVYSGNLRKQNSSVTYEFGALIDGSIISLTNQLLADCENQLNLLIPDNSYLQLLVYLSLSVQRMRENHFIQERLQPFSEMSVQPEYAVAEYIMRQLRILFELSVSVDETLYLAVFLSGIRIWPPEHRDLTQSRDLNVHQITLAIIQNISLISSIDFMEDSRLPIELSTHIQPTIGRLRAGIPIENPLLEDFQTNHPDIYAACEQGVSVLHQMLDIDSVPASEIGFIAFYFAMAMDRIKKARQRISVILVCPAGIGSSRLLASNLKEEYPDLNIRGIISAFEIDCEKLKADGIDLIISTIRLDINYRYLHVNPMLNRQDRMLLDSKIKRITREKFQGDSDQTPSTHTPPSEPFSKKDVAYISSLGNEIYRLLDNIRIGQAPVLQNREEVIAHAAMLFADSPDSEKHIFEVLKARDDLADTYIKALFALLLHGRSPRVSRPCFGYLKLEPPIYENTLIIRGAIVSLVPERDNNQAALAVTSETIGALLEEPELYKALQDMDDETFSCLLERSLLKFYKQTLRSRLN